MDGGKGVSRIDQTPETVGSLSKRDSPRSSRGVMGRLLDSGHRIRDHRQPDDHGTGIDRNDQEPPDPLPPRCRLRRRMVGPGTGTDGNRLLRDRWIPGSGRPGATLIQTLHPCFALSPYRDGWQSEDFKALATAIPFQGAMPWYARTLSSWTRVVRESGLQIEAIHEPSAVDTRPASMILVLKRGTSPKS